MSVKPIELERRITEFVAGLLERRGQAKEFSLSENLVAEGRLASIQIVELIVFLETQLGLDIAPEEFDPRLFESVESVLNFCRKKGLSS